MINDGIERFIDIHISQRKPAYTLTWRERYVAEALKSLAGKVPLNLIENLYELLHKGRMVQGT